MSPSAASPAHPSALRTLAVIPSAYALAAWSGTLLLVLWYPVMQISAQTWALIFATLCIFGCSCLFHYRSAARALNNARLRIPYTAEITFWAMATAGAVGLAVYIHDYARYFGGYSNFFHVLLTSGMTVRGAATRVQSAGFVLSYFSWIAIFYGLFIVKNRSWNYRSVLVAGVAFALFLGNFAFLDRTRPTWIFVICAAAIMMSNQSRKIGLRAFILAATPVAFFFAFALFFGKYDNRAGVKSNFITYCIGGYGYLDSLVRQGFSGDFSVVRTFAPISKILHQLGLIPPPPPDILEFRWAPFFGNTGTFLEPLISDGGPAYMVPALAVIVVVTDGLAVRLFTAGTLFKRFLWGNLVFAAFISFFVPKFNAVALYLFLIGDAAIGLSMILIAPTIARLDSPIGRADRSAQDAAQGTQTK